jgi:rfaE bifunctional protein kinase chain/domain
MEAWSHTRLSVLGDTIVDQYAACEAIGMSAEAPVVVVRELARRDFIGAAAVVAAHIRALGAQVDLVSVVGNDSTADLVQQELKTQGIGDALTRDSSRPTTFKKRYVVDNQKLFRVSRLEQHNLDAAIEEQVIAQLEALAPQAQGIVVSDFVYGVVTPRVLAAVQDLARQHGLLLFGDLQCSSQVGSITRFQHFSLLCPNERELRLALQDKDSGLESLSQQLLADTHCERLIVKLAAEGFIAYDRTPEGRIMSQPFPALSVNPLDVAGAGDSVLAVMATGLASRQAMMPTAALACCIAAVIATPLANVLELTNIVMLFLLVVVGVALRFGRGPAIMAAFLGTGIISQETGQYFLSLEV